MYTETTTPPQTTPSTYYSTSLSNNNNNNGDETIQVVEQQANEMEDSSRRQTFSEDEQSSLLDFVSSVYAFVTNQAFYLEQKLENGLSKLDDFKERTLNYFAGEEATVAYEPKHHIIEEESTAREE